jgi:hypothetical protein
MLAYEIDEFKFDPGDLEEVRDWLMDRLWELDAGNLAPGSICPPRDPGAIPDHHCLVAHVGTPALARSITADSTRFPW